MYNSHDWRQIGIFADQDLEVWKGGIHRHIMKLIRSNQPGIPNGVRPVSSFQVNRRLGAERLQDGLN